MKCACPRLVLAVVALLGVFGCSPSPSYNLVIISLDTVRRDHLPTYGYQRDTAPALDRLAQESWVFDEAFAQDTNTNPSHASLFTGLYPHRHGSISNGVRLGAEQRPLAAILGDAGFRTGAFVSGATLQRRACGLERGFQEYDDDFEGRRRDGRVTTQRALEWLRALPHGERFFLFLHFYDAHGPYQPADPYASLFHRAREDETRLARIPNYQRYFDGTGGFGATLEPYIDRYDAMIRFVDDRVSDVLDAIDRERTIIVVFSDHGETLGERFHVLDHGGQAFDEQIRIALLLYVPSLIGRRSGELVETIDVLPTLLDLLGVEAEAAVPVQGKSLAPLLRDGAWAGREVVFSTARSATYRHADRGYTLDQSRRIQSVRSRQWKLIRYPGSPRDYLELYDLGQDPGERKSIADERPALRDSLVQTLDTWYGAGPGRGSEPPIDPITLERLRELGYVD